MPAKRVEHVITLVVNDLDTFHLGIDIQDVDDDIEQLGPGVLKHTARGVDDEDNILAVHRDTAHQIVLASSAFAQQPLLLIGQRLLGSRKLFGLFDSFLRDAVGGVEFTLNGR